MPVFAQERGGGQSRYTSPSGTQSSTTTATINPRQSIQLYGSNSTNTSPTSTYQPSQLGNQPTSSINSNSGAVNPFLSPYVPPRQLHPPKSPLYRPAVLRTTERSSRPSTSNGGLATSGHQSTGSVSSLGEGKEGNNGLAIFGGGDMLSSVFGTTNLGALAEWEEVVNKQVTGPPNRRHWKDDSLSSTCDSPLCARSFTLFERRHHCRKCGQIFCAAHTSNYVRLDQDCEYHPQGTLSRTCDSCFEEYKRLVAQRRASSASTITNSSGGSTVPSSPITSKGSKGADAFGPKTASSCVGSVPRDWTWSTF